MNEIIEALRALIANPDDLSGLPNIITQLEQQQTAIATRESEDLDRITNLQNANRSLLSQIPIGTGTPEDKPKDEEVTFEDAQQELLKAMQNVGGN